MSLLPGWNLENGQFTLCYGGEMLEAYVALMESGVYIVITKEWFENVYNGKEVDEAEWCDAAIGTLTDGIFPLDNDGEIQGTFVPR